MALDPLTIDLVAFALFLSLTLGYHTYYIVVLRHHPARSVRARMHEHRANWIEMVQKRGERIMAVQALRNLIMTNTFLASTMILLVAFIANYVIVDPSRSPFRHHDPNLFAGAMPVAVKGAVLLVLYAFAFVMFLTTLRSLNHLSILVGVDPEQVRQTEGRDPKLFMAERLNLSESLNTYGRRALYFSLPVFAWFFSPWLFAALALSIWLFFVYVTDFAPARTTRSQKVEEPAVPPTAAQPK